MMAERPLIGITIGDPSSIGPEIIVKSLAIPKVYAEARPLLIGSSRIIKREISNLGLQLSVNQVCDPQEGKYALGAIDIVDIDNIDPAVPYGRVSKVNGAASYEYIKKSVELALARKIDGVATAPIHKEAIHDAGIEYIGHTEMFAGLTKSPSVLTMFHVNKMRIFFLTRHLSLLKAVAYVTHDNVLQNSRAVRYGNEASRVRASPYSRSRLEPPCRR